MSVVGKELVVYRATRNYKLYFHLKKYVFLLLDANRLLTYFLVKDCTIKEIECKEEIDMVIQRKKLLELGAKTDVRIYYDRSSPI